MSTGSLAHLARLHLIESDPSLFGTQGEQPRWLRRSLGEGLRLGFKLNPVGHWSRSSITYDSAQRVCCTRTFLYRSSFSTA